MMSSFHFESLLMLVRSCKSSGVQWLFSGDFCQLPSSLVRDTVRPRLIEPCEAQQREQSARRRRSR